MRTYGKPIVDFVATYDTYLSKNQRMRFTRRGSTYKPALSQAAEKVLHTEAVNALGRKKFYQNKVYLDITVYKSRTNVDAVNFIDVIADVLKVVIGVDDKFFCIKQLEWELDRKNPRIRIKIYQPDRYNG